MTPEAPSRNPQTAAGRGLILSILTAGAGGYPMDPDQVDAQVLAIEAEAAQRVVKRVLLEAAHYNVLQGKVAHANLRMICRAAIGDSAGEEEGS